MNVLITGTSKGLGKGFAEYFLNQGDKVIGFSRSSDPILLSNTNFQHNSIDLKDLDQIKNAVKQAINGIQELDLVILNAGIIGEIKTMMDSTITSMKEVMDINLWANKVVMDTLFEAGIKVKQIVAISSGASVNGNKGWSGYSISKAALNMMIKLYASEHEETHFNALAPGLIDSEMQDYLCGQVDKNEFPSVERLQSARGTEVMPNGTDAAKKIITFLPTLMETPSGSYQDIRKL